MRQMVNYGVRSAIITRKLGRQCGGVNRQVVGEVVTWPSQDRRPHCRIGSGRLEFDSERGNIWVL